MSSKLSPLLAETLERFEHAVIQEEQMQLARHYGGKKDDSFPVLVRVRNDPPAAQNSWSAHKKVMSRRLDQLAKSLGIAPNPSHMMLAAGALFSYLTEPQIRKAEKRAEVVTLHLDRPLHVVNMNDMTRDLGVSALRQRSSRHSGSRLLDGSGVRVAVLDSGIDSRHPSLRLTKQVTVCDEDVSRSGYHGTHCAGIIASQDTTYNGIAPAVDLVDVKVLRAVGTGFAWWVARGIDAALDEGAHVISMSLGFNHFHRTEIDGHDWWCPNGRCILCSAVDRAVQFGCLVVVAAGNGHDKAQDLRGLGRGSMFDTEITCPGNARESITVGAVTKGDAFESLFMSSHGPTPYGLSKPDLCAPGRNITSTVPVVSANDSSFNRESGTSMATPMVAAALALILQRRLASGESIAPADVRAELLNEAVVPVGGSPLEYGRGRLYLGRL